MIRKILCLLLLFIGARQATAQQYFTVSMSYPKALGDSLRPLFIRLERVYYHNSNDIKWVQPDSVRYERIGDSCITTCRYPLRSDSLRCFLAEGPAKHDILMEAGDTLYLTCSKSDSVPRTISYLPFYEYVYGYRGKYAAMEAFEDSLGTLFHLNPFFVEYLGAAPNPDSTLTARLMLSQACIRYTRAYCNRHQLGDWFFEREKTRIQANFLFTLYNFHMHHPSEFRKYFARNEGLLDTAVISRYKLDEQAFAQDILFHGAAEAYALSDYFYHYPDVVNDTLKFLQKYQHYKSLYPKNNAIKAYLLADLLYAYSKFNYPQADSLARDFASLYPGSADAQRVDSITAFYRSSYLNMDSVVALPELVDKRGQRTSLTEVVRQAHRPVFIDCWATWCIPCMKEMAYSHELEMRYGDSVVFIYLSMDHHPEDWIRHLDKNHLEKGQYRLEGDSHSALAKTFAIHSIPRYLLYDGNGKLVTMFSPRPSDSRIGPLLDKLIR